MIQETVYEVQSTLKRMVDASNIAWERQENKRKIEKLQKDKDWLEVQNDALRQEISRMLGSAMRRHWETVRDMSFYLDGYEFQGKEYIATIRPSLRYADWIRLPWRTNIALLFRWAFMQLLPQHAFNALIARATFSKPIHGGVGGNKSKNNDLHNVATMLDDAVKAAETLKKDPVAMAREAEGAKTAGKRQKTRKTTKNTRK